MVVGFFMINLLSWLLTWDAIYTFFCVFVSIQQFSKIPFSMLKPTHFFE